MKLLSKIQQNYGILLIIAIGIFLRFYHLGFQSAWLDEVLVLKESDPDSTFKVVYDAVLLRDSTSFLHIFSIYYLGQIWEHNIFLARLISAIAGVLSIYYIYKLGLLMLNKRAGYFAATLLTFNLYHIEYSQEARSYALLTLLVIIAFYRFYHYTLKPNLSNAIYLGIFMGLLTNAHPIGLLNVASIFLVLFLIFIFKKDWKSRINIIKGGTIAGIIMLLIFSFIYPIVLAASKITSFWIPAASFEGVKQAFAELAGRSILLLWVYIAAFLYLTIKAIIAIIKNKKAFFENKIILSYVILLIWIGLEVATILIKSFYGVSILLSRYMIAILPAMALVLAIGIEFINNRILKYGILIFAVGLSLYNIFYKADYYNAISKAQFRETANFLNIKNIYNDKVVSRYGYVVSYYINKGNPETKVVENQLDDYITAMKNGSIPEESFWYFDGNSAPYIVSTENQIYLDQKFILKEDKTMFDCWAKYYVSKSQTEKNLRQNKLAFESGQMKLSFKKFKPVNLDHIGNILMFENSIIKSSPISIPVGSYSLVISGNSFPNVPIDGENAHLKIRINDKMIGHLHLSEKSTEKKHEIKFTIDTDKPIIFSIEFDNDISKEGLDRNVILYGLTIQVNKF